ncbi:dihydrofolate reductase [Zavarzinia compransoris]|uniref:Dihydrofolate reductase n=2 Tax=Zavarzinia compransoris TaxID=1264899 RepID=A0A317DWH1_9PROT|nr:hypothetical protein DKG75_18075 [Zavarzinia compransoris]TDP48876.1 dihydrofolate reductase [Zavarzinia compransoris]
MVAARGRNGVIGAGNAMPWRMRSDLAHFKAATLGKPLVMGRKTYESIGRPLPGRRTIVVTRDPGFAAAGVEVARDLPAALALAQALAADMGADAVIVAGGATLYAQAMPLADRLVLTELDLAPVGDTWFPTPDPADWVEVSREPRPRGEGDDASYDIVVMARR